tara:strand:- start:560 stop:730 length:171 start_codon:yes stop_codon:yes gene_type:complete
MIKSEKTFTIYKPSDIYKVIDELNKGAKELGKLTLEEQMERLERLRLERLKEKDCL